MDAWNPDQLRKMQAGGNAKLNEFFQQHGIPKATDIKVKYNNRVAEVCVLWCRIVPRRPWPRPYEHACCPSRPAAPCPVRHPCPPPLPLQVYRDKIRAEVEGRPFTAPAPGSIRVDLSGGAPPAASAASNGSMGRPGGGAGWDDWGAGGGGGGGGGAAAANGRSGGSYTMAQLQDSAAHKESFFERRMMENASRPEGLPPSQGGKYVGFGSAPAPRPGGGAGGLGPGASGIDDVGVLLSKGLQTLSVAAGSAAGTAGDALRHGTAQVSSLLAEKQVAETAKQVAEKSKDIASAGWLGLQKLYANVASTVESAAKESGYKIDLGARQVAANVQQQQFVQQYGHQVNMQGGDAYGGYGGGPQHMQHSASDGRLQQHPHHGGGAWQQQRPQQQPPPQRGGGGGGGGGGAAGGFSGFNDGGWDEWGGAGRGGGGGAAGGPARTGIAPQKSISSPDMRKQEDDSWGKW
jgi:ADP-ribosylation factor GTPase-activating protein 1